MPATGRRPCWPISPSAATCALWFKLDHTDGDWVTFINYLIAAYREAVPDFGRVTLPLLANIAAANPTREVVLGTFMSELGRLTEEPMLLILDDYHLVDESSDVQLIMSRLLRDAPPTLSYVLLTRRKPELPIGRLSAMGEVASSRRGPAASPARRPGGSSPRATASRSKTTFSTRSSDARRAGRPASSGCARPSAGGPTWRFGRSSGSCPARPSASTTSWRRRCCARPRRT
jgi:hypothetical protein